MDRWLADVFCSLFEARDAVLKESVDEARHGNLQPLCPLVELLDMLIRNLGLIHLTPLLLLVVWYG